MAVVRRLGAALLAATLALPVAACGDNDPADPGPTSSPSSTSPTDEETSTSPSSPTSPVEPSVTPASGIELMEKTSAVRAPAGWTKNDPLVGYASSASAPDGSGSVQLVDSVDLSGGSATLDEMAQIAIDGLPEDARVERLPDVDLAGEPAFHLRYSYPGDSRVQHNISIVARNGRAVGLDIILAKRTERDQPDLIESMLVTFRWR